MTCWTTNEAWNTTLVLAVLQMDGRCVVSEWMLVSMLSVSLSPRKMLWAVATLALAPLCGDLKPEDLVRPFLLMWVFKKLNLS